MGKANAVVVAALSAAGLAGLMVSSTTATPPDPFAHLPLSLNLTAVIRDFKAAGSSGGHSDFESYGNPHITTGLVNNVLDAQGKPTFLTRRGKQITANYTDSSGRIINPAHFNASLGDRAGAMSTVGSDQLTSSAKFAQWYRDTPGVNLSKSVPLVFNRVPNTNRYVFDSAVDAPYAPRGGFFPIDGDLFGNQGSTGHNFAFTTELNTRFTYARADNQVFKFTGDDDVWVFINGKLVLDLGGLHPRKEQSLELNRLNWLVDGSECTLSVFHAERHTNESNFRIETTIRLVPARLPQAAGLHD
ncbi:MAG TPA: fibro-slime domain-containing protein [Phycisphaerales bacterium]|nr:fibro-slime domain-containing protein [Phycisphaerales bacterium]